MCDLGVMFPFIIHDQLIFELICLYVFIYNVCISFLQQENEHQNINTANHSCSIINLSIVLS